MKKLVTLFTSAVLAASIGTTAFADTNIDTTAKDAGITPDSILYPIDLALDNLKLALTSGTLEKAHVEIQIANERLSESIVMTVKNKPSLAAAAAEKYNTNISQAQNTLQTEIKDSADTENNETNDKTAALENEVTAEQEKGAEALKDIENKVPEETKAKISSVIEMQTAKIEAVKNMVDARHKLNAARKDYNKAEVALNKAEKSGDTKAIEAAKTSLAASQTAYIQANDTFKKAFAGKQEAIKKANAAKKAAETTDNNTTSQPADTTPTTSTTQGAVTTQSTAAVQSTTPAQNTSVTQNRTTKEADDNKDEADKDNDENTSKPQDKNHRDSDNGKSVKSETHKNRK